MLTAAPSLPQAVAPLAVTVAVASLALKALGLFPTRGAVGVVRVLEKEKKHPQNGKDDCAEMSGSLGLTSADSSKT